MIKEKSVPANGAIACFSQKFAINPYLVNERAEYRSTTVKNILIVYKVEPGRIVVINILHGKTNPEKFSDSE
jgi:hypothetical protein